MQLSLFLVSALGALAREYQGHNIEGYVFKSVQEVYGAVTPSAARAYNTHRKALFKELRDHLVEETRARASASRWFGASGGVAANEYEHLRTPDNCAFPIDLLILQDATGSFQVDFDLTVNNTLPAIDKVMPERHPNTRISLMTFKDKPFHDLGEPEDYCQKIHALNEPTAEALRPHFMSTPVGGGYDYPENQYGAIVTALNSPESMPWNSNPLATKLVLLVTDAQPHFGGDAQQDLYPQLSEWGNDYDENAADVFCRERYYPTPETVKNAIHDSRTYFASIIVRPNDPIAKPLPAWQWFNSFIGFPETFVKASTNELEGWFTELLEILEALENEECVYEPTTTPEPTTTTTEPTTTTPASGEIPTSEDANNCVCPPGKPDCCVKQPEVWIALMKRPQNLDIHLVGPEDTPTP